MSDGVQYWIVYAEGLNDQNKQQMLGLAYCGVEIVWEYLVELIEEEYELTNVQINGYHEITEKQFQEMSTE